MGKAVTREQRRRGDWLVHLCVTALAAGAVVAVGHWFSYRQGRCIGGDKRRLSKASDNVKDEEDELDNETSSKGARSMSLADLRLRRLKAAEARLHFPRNEASAASLTPLGRILKLAPRVDKLDEETQSLLGKVSVAKDMIPSEEKEQVRLMEELTLLQMEIDGIPGDESVRPHKKRQTNRIQTLLANLDQLKHCEILAGPIGTEAGLNSI